MNEKASRIIAAVAKSISFSSFSSALTRANHTGWQDARKSSYSSLELILH